MTRPAPVECPRCEGSGLDPDSRPSIPASHFAPAEGGSPCCSCGGSGDSPPTCEECGDAPATQTGADGSLYCAVCAAEIALEAERQVQAVRVFLAGQPRIVAQIAKARGVFPAPVNDVIEATR